MKIISILLLAVGFMLVGCDHIGKIEYGKMTRNGNFFYELCERGKGRITEIKSMSFELPELFKQAPCTGGWPDYVYGSGNDEITVSIPSVVTRGNLMAIGLGGHSMEFRPGIFYSDRERKWKYSWWSMATSPEVFLEERAFDNYGNLREHGFVEAWSGGRCGRILFGTERSLDYIHEVEYYCWPYSSGNKRQVPIYIRASQSIPKKREGMPPKSDFTDLDNQLIKPVLDSLVFYPLPEEAFQVMADTFSSICNIQQNAFFNKIETNSQDFPDRRSIILSIRDCGYDVPLSETRIDSCNEIFEKTRDEKLDNRKMVTAWITKDYQLIEIRFPQGGRISYESVKQQREEDRYYVPTFNNGEVWTVYKISREKFARIKQKLLALDVLKETEPVARQVRDPKQKTISWRGGIDYIDLPYEAWYYVPPRYERTRKQGIKMQSHRAGFGFRYDQELKANVIDINFKDPKTISTYDFVTLVEGD